ncbi:helix-turn-helix domain-containing protein [Spirosoma radiotolerans]|uniref:AraC family transcriptional regulator n=1 Tax=Spirosoma radiotolerans TaxID=1379870 RepID=A0A0E3V7W0_9BACT|nr:AraC family transcriptional regulator [Spirosoma radiotolerans]AKD55781.1 AraC family transcriptional regulator [Spirosoma radiotolerans]
MPELKKIDRLPQIVYSCYFTRSREGEQFVPEHIFSYQIAGTLTMNDGHNDYTFREGDFRFSRRNQLIKFVKQPPADGEFKALSIYLDQETLRKFSLDYGYTAEPHQEGNPILELTPNALYKSYMDSLLPYLQAEQPINENLQALKLNEAILILLQANPGLKDILFDFSEPGKLDLEGFMNKNFHFNVELKRFAYLTGRSLATFKRDFEKIFHSTPSRWIQQRRLQEAYYLIKEKGKAPSDVYLELGFEDLSHFSFAFKKTYGLSPSKI